MEPATIAGFVAAEQAVSTTLEVGVPAAYALTRPTLPLSATLTRITSPAFLPRCHHTCCVIDKHAYLYGGEDDKGKLAGGEIHIVTLPLPIKKGRVGNGEADYKCIPPLGRGLEKPNVDEEDQGGEDEMGAGQVEGHEVDEEVPSPRKWHTAVSVGNIMYVFGGRDESGLAIVEKIKGRIWVFDTETLRWSALDPVEGADYGVPEGRWGHGCASSEQPQPKSPSKTSAAAQGLGEKIGKGIEGVAQNIATLVKGKAAEVVTKPHGTLVVHGGVDAEHKSLKDTWSFNIAEKRWSRLPDPPTSGGPQLAIGRLAISGEQVFLVAHPDPTGGGEVHHLHLTFPAHKQDTSTEAHGPQDPDETGTLKVTKTPEQRIQDQMIAQGTQDPSPTWHSHTFPANPLTPGPLPRQGAALLPLHYRNGRQYLLYALGAHMHNPFQTPPPGAAEQYHSSIYAYQPPSSAASPAGVKDAIRAKAGAESGEGSWGEVTVQANAEVGGDGDGGKAHPGPRGWFASAALEGADGVGAVLWGGKNAKGEVEGDGWVVSVEAA